MRLFFIALIPVLILCWLLVVLAVGLNNAQPKLNTEQIHALVGSEFPGINLEALSVEAANPKGEEPYLVNIFGSWCVACLAEHPQLLALKDSGVRVVGIAWRDNVANLNVWLERHGNPYSMIYLDPAGQAVIDLGVTGAPETFLVDGRNIIQFHHAGPLTQVIIDEMMELVR